MFQKLLQADKENYMMAASVKPENEEEKE